MNGSPNRARLWLVLLLTATVAGVAGLAAYGWFKELTHRSCAEVMDEAILGAHLLGNDAFHVILAAPVAADRDSADTVEVPSLLNVDEVVDVLLRSLGEQSPDPGFTGVANAHFLVDEAGMVQDPRIETGSGDEAVDEAVLALSAASSFSAAEDDQGPTEARVEMSVCVQVLRRGLLDRLR